jgi:VanZ family protein
MTALLTRLQLTVALALLVFAVLLVGCALFGLSVHLALIGAVAVLAVWWAGVSVGELVLDKWGEK